MSLQTCINTAPPRLAELIRFANGSVLAGILMAVASLMVRLPISGSIVVLFVILLFNFLVATRMSFRALRTGIHRLTNRATGS